MLGGGTTLFHCSSSPISQKNSTYRVYTLPDRDSALGKRTVGSQEKLPAVGDSPESTDQAQALPPSDSSSTNTSDLKITSQATVEVWEELIDELQRQWLLEGLAEIGFDDPEQ